MSGPPAGPAPELEPGSYAEPEPEPELEPMPGQGPLWCGVGLRDGGEGVPGLGVVELPLDAALLVSALPAPEPDAPLLDPVLPALELDAAEAPVMPEAAPPAASAPATMVAPSILDMFIGKEPPGEIGGVDSAILAVPAKAPRRRT